MSDCVSGGIEGHVGVCSQQITFCTSSLQQLQPGAGVVRLDVAEGLRPSKHSKA